MSGLVTGLTIGGAFAGAIAGPLLAYLEQAGSMFGSPSSQRNMAVCAGAGALAGAALLGGGGWVYEGGLKEVFQPSSQSTDAPSAAKTLALCLEKAPHGSSVTFTTDQTGRTHCTYTPG